MVKHTSPELPQETLFALTPAEPELTVPTTPVVTNPTLVRSFRTPDQDRTSEAFADLGGGTSETASEETPTTHRTRQRRPRTNRRGGRSYSEGTYSELDPNWTEPAPEQPPEVKAVVHEKMVDYIEQRRIENATRSYRAEVDGGNVSGALQRLRAKGFRPDPETHGTTVIRLGEASKIRDGE